MTLPPKHSLLDYFWQFPLELTESKKRQQQSRWAQSAQINFLQMTYPLLMPRAEIWKLSWWSASDLLYLGFFAYLVGVLIRLGYRFFVTSATLGISPALVEVLPYAIVFALSNLWKGVSAAYTNKNWRGLVNGLYFIVVIFVITPIKLRRNFNLRDSRWGGRPTPTQDSVSEKEIEE